MAKARRDGVRCVVAERVPDLVAEIFDPSRILPLILVTTSQRHGDKPLVNLTELSERLLGRADVALLADQSASWALDAAIPEKWRTYGGYVRIFLADASEGDPAERHPLIYVSPERSSDALRHIVGRVHSVTSVWTVQPRTGPLLALPVGEENQQLLAKLDDAKRKLAAARREKRELQGRVRALRLANDGVSPLLPPPVYADPDRQNRYEIEQVWLWRYSEAERDNWPLKPHRFGPDWHESLPDAPAAQRRDIIDIVTDVLTGRAAEVLGRQVRPHKTHAAGGAPQLVRSDGATAWRCNIKTNSPAAPRMTWWKLTDGTIELGRVSLHDDTRLR
ncbi:hypothetical protein [Streptomyces yaizuensis]|uniref:Uncharacterized protein n=1 Tax=Streptomyces yaizuensis TaxID=2989713 RepID=A0ABQ5P660_9ACTN|nr:hypothetical protein [Streptomyces sp. YSPA8]GLF98066.1 hypothetical protein SYYSPA8_27235 [Streptomyces sp. YSPA8]